MVETGSLVRQQGLEGAGPSRTGRGPRLSDFPSMEQASAIEAHREVDPHFRPQDTTLEALHAMKVGGWLGWGCGAVRRAGVVCVAWWALGAAG